MNILAVFAEHAATVDASTRLIPQLERAASMLQACLASGHRVLACGNGGSATTAQHLVAELTCRFRDNRRALAAIALTADTATLTAIGNDFGYERVFARQVEALATAGDALLAISTSGNSPNVLAAAQAARAAGCHVIALTGASGGALAPLAELALQVPSTVVARIQEVHDICIHVLAEAIELNVLA